MKEQVSSTQFMLKQIENEIRAGFRFVAAASKAFRLNDHEELRCAIGNASLYRRYAEKHIQESPEAQVRSIAQQMADLRDAIDWLREAHNQPTSRQSA